MFIDIGSIKLIYTIIMVADKNNHNIATISASLISFSTVRFL